MKIFKFEIEIGGKDGYTTNKTVRSNHLQGAIRQMYQNIPNMTRVVRILSD
ncbi:MAG: hypothetical protein K2G89_03395 [Lachnospiraceae bacterium]|nr:hypothetical protein [Lachnospiraceae bacterium]